MSDPADQPPVPREPMLPASDVDAEIVTGLEHELTALLSTWVARGIKPGHVLTAFAYRSAMLAVLFKVTRRAFVLGCGGYYDKLLAAHRENPGGEVTE